MVLGERPVAGDAAGSCVRRGPFGVVRPDAVPDFDADDDVGAALPARPAPPDDGLRSVEPRRAIDDAVGRINDEDPSIPDEGRVPVGVERPDAGVERPDEVPDAAALLGSENDMPARRVGDDMVRDIAFDTDDDVGAA